MVFGESHSGMSATRTCYPPGQDEADEFRFMVRTGLGLESDFRVDYWVGGIPDLRRGDDPLDRTDDRPRGPPLSSWNG